MTPTTSPLKTFNVFAAFASDIDTIVFDGNSFDGRVGCTPKPEEMKPEDMAREFVLFWLGCQFDGCVVEFFFFCFTWTGSCRRDGRFFRRQRRSCSLITVRWRHWVFSFNFLLFQVLLRVDSLEEISLSILSLAFFFQGWWLAVFPVLSNFPFSSFILVISTVFFDFFSELVDFCLFLR